MKRVIFLMLVALMGLSFAACDDGWHTEGRGEPLPPRDTTIAGSICCHTANNTVNAECMFDGNPINVSYVESEENVYFVEISKVSDTEVGLSCHIKTAMNTVMVEIPAVRVSGDVCKGTFDTECEGAGVTLNGVDYLATVGVKGRVVNTCYVVYGAGSISAPYRVVYNLTISCNLDGKPFMLKVQGEAIDI